MIRKSIRSTGSRHPCIKSKRAHGFTLQELVVTLTIGSILTSLSFALPQLVRHETISAETNLILANMYLARSESVKTGKQVLLCKSQDKLNCSNTASWHDGWIIFVDDNDNYQREPSERIIQVKDKLPDSLTLSFRAWGPGRGRYLSFQPSGFIQQNGTFALCDKNGKARPRGILIMQSGRARVSYQGSARNPRLCS